jgi:hypothetical protein
MKIKRSYAITALAIYTILFAVVYIWFFPASPQNVAYHNFADARHLLGIDNFFNVISNIGFMLAGLWGIYLIFTYRRNTTFVNASERWPYLVFFVGAVLIAFGSSYYHLNPNNSTILWDRLPMCIDTMAFFLFVFTERVNIRLGLFLTIPLLIIGMLAPIWWELSEMAGHGDMRLYSWGQIYPITATIIILLFFSPRYTKGYYILGSIAWYAGAKFFEHFDVQVYNLTHHIVSGHVIKHLMAAFGMFVIARYLMCRKALPIE